jgi:uncharacterized protein with gpF-like domain
MTNEEQNIHWLKFHRFQKRYESIYTPQVNKALQQQHEQYIDNGTLMAVNSAPIYKVLHSLYIDSAYIWAHRATANLRKERLTMGFSERIIELMKNYFGIDLLNLAEDITQTTKDVIQAVLSDAAEQGFGFDEIVRRLRSTELTSKRARLIARTETVASANAASNVAAQDSGLIMDKIWISAKDRRTRLHHREVDEHIVAMHDTFTVGFTQMKFPGDKAGGAEECCNCRCTHAFIPRRDANGRLLRN